jgi:hypothetical protein
VRACVRACRVCSAGTGASGEGEGWVRPQGASTPARLDIDNRNGKRVVRHVPCCVPPRRWNRYQVRLIDSRNTHIASRITAEMKAREGFLSPYLGTHPVAIQQPMPLALGVPCAGGRVVVAERGRGAAFLATAVAVADSCAVAVRSRA